MTPGELPAWARMAAAPLDGCDDDPDRLRMLGSMIRDAERHLENLRLDRLRTAQRLRDDGYAMIDIAKWARVTDSYLTRRLIQNGARRRTARRMDYG